MINRIGSSGRALHLLEGSTAISTLPGGNAPHLVFLVDGQPYACPIHYINHLLRQADAKIKPAGDEAPPWECGLLEDAESGGDLPIISLRTLWGLPTAHDSGDLHQVVLIASVEGHSFSMLVDGCQCVLSHLPGGSSFTLPSPIKGDRAKALGAAVPWDKTLLITVDLHQLLEGLLGAEEQGESNSAESI